MRRGGGSAGVSLPALSVGIEAGAAGNLECDIVRAGGFVRYEWASGRGLGVGGASNDKLWTAAPAAERSRRRARRSRSLVLADPLLIPIPGGRQVAAPRRNGMNAGRLCAMVSGQAKKTTVRHNKENAMKSILLPVDQSEQMPSALETAWLLASLFEGTVEGVALRPAFAEIVAPDPIVAVTIPPADWNETEFCRSVRQTFDAFAAAHPARGETAAPASAGAADRPSRTARSAAWAASTTSRC